MPFKNPETRKAYHKQQSHDHYIKNKEETKQRSAATRKKKREEWVAFKSTLMCTKCGFMHPAALDFHHTDPSQKTSNVHKFAANGQYKKAHEEIKKCIVLCANCHRIHHHNEKSVKIPPLQPTSTQTCR
jgi:cytochrome c553